MSKKNSTIKLPLRSVLRILRINNILYKEHRMPNGLGVRIDLITKEFRSILIDAYDTGAVTIQGGKKGQEELKEHLIHALKLYQHKLMRKEKSTQD